MPLRNVKPGCTHTYIHGKSESSVEPEPQRTTNDYFVCSPSVLSVCPSFLRSTLLTHWDTLKGFNQFVPLAPGWVQKLCYKTRQRWRFFPLFFVKMSPTGGCTAQKPPALVSWLIAFEFSWPCYGVLNNLSFEPARTRKRGENGTKSSWFAIT